MERFRRAANGKRLFTTELKREQVGRVVRGEVTIAELSRELEVSPSLVRRWKHLMQEGGQTAVAANGDVVPAYKLRDGHAAEHGQCRGLTDAHDPATT